MPRTNPGPPRLVDLHCDWLLQYAGETTTFDPALYQDVSARIGQAEGYLSGVSAAVLSCYRRATDWAAQADPWGALDALITRIEAEFPGRLLIGPEDLGRWLDDADGLCWAVLGIEGFDPLIRSTEDLPRLRRLFDRGVRVFQPVYGPSSALGGSSSPGDDRGLTPLGLAFLEALAELPGNPAGPRPILDLAHLNPSTMSDVLDWLEADAGRPGRVLPVYSHGAPRHPGFEAPRALSGDAMRRLRELGGTIGISLGPPFFESTEEVRAAIEAAAAVPFQGRLSFEGLAIGTDYLGVDRTLPELANVGRVLDWLHATFPPPVAEALTWGNGRGLLRHMLTGVRG